MAYVLLKPAILPPPKIQLIIRKRNAIILPPGTSLYALPPPLLPLLLLLPLQPSPAPPPLPTIITKEEELE